MPAVAAIRRRLGDERGFTLIELLTTMAIGMVVLLAVISLTEVGARSASRTTDRADTTQRSRLAMTFITQGLRSQVCPTATKPPIATATNDTATGVEQLTYYADPNLLNSSAPQPETFAPQRRRLTFDPRSGGSIVEDVWDAKRKTNPPFPAEEVGEPELLTTPADADPKFQYPGPVRTRTLLRGVSKVGGSTDFLRYYGFESSSQLATSLSTSTTQPIPTNSIAKVVRIDVSFTAEPSSGNAEPERDSDMQTSVYLRNSDYTNQEAASIARTWGPRCD